MYMCVCVYFSFLWFKETWLTDDNQELYDFNTLSNVEIAIMIPVLPRIDEYEYTINANTTWNFMYPSQYIRLGGHPNQCIIEKLY